jgi:hypothetical protein
VCDVQVDDSSESSRLAGSRNVGVLSTPRTVAFMMWGSPSGSKHRRASGWRTTACSMTLTTGTEVTHAFKLTRARPRNRAQQHIWRARAVPTEAASAAGNAQVDESCHAVRVVVATDLATDKHHWHWRVPWIRALSAGAVLKRRSPASHSCRQPARVISAPLEKGHSTHQELAASSPVGCPGERVVAVLPAEPESSGRAAPACRQYN